MATYWVTFRIAEKGDYDSRYESFMATMRDLSGGKWWVEPTSFVVFNSEKTIDEVADEIGGSFDVSRDLALVGMPEFQDARVVGASVDPDLFDFMPFAKKV